MGEVGTVEPVTVSGWYEHTAGTWGRYGWGQAGLTLRETAAAGEPRLNEQERIERDVEAEALARRVEA